MNDGAAGDKEVVNAVFRAVHSIKGGAGAFGLAELVRFAHKFETALDDIRSDRLEATQDVLKVLFRSADWLADLVRASRDGAPIDASKSDALIVELEALGGGAREPVVEAPVEFTPMTLDLDLGMDFGAPEAAAGPAGFAIRFVPTRKMYASGSEAALILRDLARLGDVAVECDAGALPLLDALDPEESYLAWSIELTADAIEPTVRDVFEWVESDCALDITPLGGAPEPFQAIEAAPEFEPIATPEPAPEPVKIEAPKAAPKAEAKPEAKADAKSEGKAAAASGEQATVRVALDRVDRLINLVGELVINQAMITQCVHDEGLARVPAVANALDEFKQLTREIQESVMAIRAQPVKSLFQRMARIVRESGDATGKKVKLVTEGENTEVDKTVVERLSDPLTHMIRNAVDHGLESTQKRIEAGKPAEGVVRLTAAHRSGRVVIEISDDGAGINRARVREKAIEKGLIPADSQLTNSEIDNLLFLPGFSTAQTVSNLSGRGVGMDVVKRAVQALGGKISISSRPGNGTTFSISLPLTLAVLDGMVVSVAGQTLVAPLTAIKETLRPNPRDVHGIGIDGAVVAIRGEFLPLIDVGRELGFRREATDIRSSVVLSVETDGGVRNALLVDSIQDQRQVVIKSLEDNYGAVPGVAAATILGDGRVALILDVDALVASVAAEIPEQRLAAAG
jgi:two-component system chemotaxis sensor kinase CheA